MNVDRLREESDAQIGAADLPKLWSGITQGRKDHGRRLQRSRIAATALVAAFAGAFAMSMLPKHEPAAIAPSDDWASLGAAVKEGRPFALLDGSRLIADPGTELELTRLETSAVDLEMGLGRVSFTITPGGPRAWTIDAGLAKIRVIGTRFVVTRSIDRVDVAVEAGIVEVSGPTIPAGRVRLGPGESIVVEAAPTAAPAAVVAPAAPAPVAPKRAPVVKATPIIEAPEAPVVIEAETLASLLAAAEAARLRGDHAGAAKILEDAIARHPSAPSIPMAAFSLGRLELEVLGRPERAAKAYAKALELGLPEALEEDAHARLVEAAFKAGDREGAAAAAKTYRAAFPKGRRAADVRRWVP